MFGNSRYHFVLGCSDFLTQVSYVLPDCILPLGQVGNIALQFGNITGQAIGPNEESYSDDYNNTHNRDVSCEPL